MKEILCGCGEGTFCVYNLSKGSYEMIQSEHTDSINNIIKLDDNTIVSCSSDNTLKVWKYK